MKGSEVARPTGSCSVWTRGGPPARRTNGAMEPRRQKWGACRTRRKINKNYVAFMVRGATKAAQSVGAQTHELGGNREQKEGERERQTEALFCDGKAC